jgi:ubiquinone/menaquinone biosynthesis C-methylase UbiE
MSHTDLSGFSDVDRTGDPRQFLKLLDTINDWPFFRDQQKPRSLELLRLQPGQRVLDVGCGVGDVTRMVAKQVGPTGRVVGIDLSKLLIDEAWRRSDGLSLPIEYATGDARVLNFAADSFDASRVDRTLMFIDEPRRALAEMVRVTRPGGWMVCGEFDMETAIVDSPYRALTRRIVDCWCDNIPSGWIGRQLPGLMKELGLRDVTVAPLTLQLTDFAQWNDVFQVGLTVKRACQANILSASEAALWLNDLQEASRAGRFFLAITLFLIAGQKSR